jgi:hypothetical protein
VIAAIEAADGHLPLYRDQYAPPMQDKHAMEKNTMVPAHADGAGMAHMNRSQVCRRVLS